MSKEWPIGNCEPSNTYYEKPDPCRINYITKHNQVRNLFQAIPRDLVIQEDFNACKEQTLIQPKLNVGSQCKPPKEPKPMVANWEHGWANLTPNERGGYVRYVNKKKTVVAPVMGKIDIPNYFYPKQT